MGGEPTELGTLLRELEDAAKVAKAMALFPGDLWDAKRCNELFVALRARAARIRELQSQLPPAAGESDAYYRGRDAAIRALTGPTVPSGGDGERETKETKR